MPSKPKIIGVPWSLKTIWNDRLDSQPERVVIPRNYIYASELGSAFCDRYLKMNAVPYTNAPNKRSKRKFIAGDAWEWIVAMVLISCGILQKKQIKVDTQLKGCIPVHGRLDFVVGGAFDYESAKKQIETIRASLSLLQIDCPPFFFDSADKFVDKYKGQILQKVIYELKSISSYMMEKVEKTGPMPHHVLQNFHYTKGNEEDILYGKIGYVCKDDCIMEEFDIPGDSNEIKKIYIKDIKQMTEYYNAGFDKKDPKRFMPPLEPEVLFDDKLFKFQKNWAVEYSNYLTYLYGYETPAHYGMWKWQPKAASWSTAFKRFVLDGQTVEYRSRGELKTKVLIVTDNNKEKRAEAMEYFPLWDKYVKQARLAGAFLKPEEQEDDEN
jgi:hypothetical protein